jgi:hypothetical protein
MDRRQSASGGADIASLPRSCRRGLFGRRTAGARFDASRLVAKIDRPQLARSSVERLAAASPSALLRHQAEQFSGAASTMTPSPNDVDARMTGRRGGRAPRAGRRRSDRPRMRCYGNSRFVYGGYGTDTAVKLSPRLVFAFRPDPAKAALFALAPPHDVERQIGGKSLDPIALDALSISSGARGGVGALNPSPWRPSVSVRRRSESRCPSTPCRNRKSPVS